MQNIRPHPFVARVLATCRRRRLLGPADRVLVAFSGGPDSTALLAAMVALRDAGCLIAVTAAHVDHRLRPGSAADAEACGATCRLLRVPLERVEVTVRAGNVQAEARRARYAALRAAAARAGATRIATGHTRSDQAETVLLRLLRGSGARGLAGIPPRRAGIVRPLIDVSRAEVLAYLADRALAFRDDPTNATPRFLRNRVRRELVPPAVALAPAAERALARAADLLRDDERALGRMGRRLAAGGRASVAALLAEPIAVRRRAVRALWRGARGRGADLSAQHVEAVLALLGRRGPGRVALPGGLEARCAYGALAIGAPTPDEGERSHPALAIPGPGSYAVSGRGLTLKVWLAPGADPGAVAWPLELRTRRPGDRFHPERGRGGKKLKAWLIDRKVPRERRDGLLVLADRRGEVLWVPELGVRGTAPGLELALA